MASFKRLHELGGPMVAKVSERLLAGESPLAVATWLQEECHVLKDLKRESVKKNLERFKQDDLRDRVIEELHEANTGVSADKIHKKVIAIDGLQDLAGIQRGRLERLLLKENTLPQGVILKEAQHEVRLFKECLVELGKLQLETGVIRRAPKTVSGETIDPLTGEVKKFSWTEEQEELMQVIEAEPVEDDVHLLTDERPDDRQPTGD